MQNLILEDIFAPSLILGHFLRTKLILRSTCFTLNGCSESVSAILFHIRIHFARGTQLAPNRVRNGVSQIRLHILWVPHSTHYIPPPTVECAFGHKSDANPDVIFHFISHIGTQSDADPDVIFHFVSHIGTQSDANPDVICHVASHIGTQSDVHSDVICHFASHIGTQSDANPDVI